MKNKLLNLMQKPVKLIINRLPARWRENLISGIRMRMKNVYAESREQIDQRVNLFLLQEGMLIFWGILALIAVASGILIYQTFVPRDIVFERNSFGGGEKEVSVILKEEDQEKEYFFVLEEQQLSEEEEEDQKEEFFQELEDQMAGQNPSLQKVQDSLNFDDAIDGWPLSITYEPEESDYIQWDGSLGEVEQELEEKGYVDTTVAVSAEYGSYHWTNTYAIHIIPKEKVKNTSPFTKAIAMLKELEKNTRGEKYYNVPDSAEDVSIEVEEGFSLSGILLFGISALMLLIMHNVLGLKDQEKDCSKEMARDFPTIVHLLALYMGAGLSLASAIHRISLDYESRTEENKKYAFEEIIWMDRQLKLGAGQQEVCAQWGRKFKDPMYQKLSLTLQQVISKGSKEGKSLMNRMEEEAFQHRIDQAKKEGEEASTKLLFPMIVLLGTVMVLVMFPAVAQFQGF